VQIIGGDSTSAQSDVHSRRDFRSYEFRPNLKRSFSAGVRITNSVGLANPEYSPAKPPHTERIALLGDSLSLGPYGHDYPALLEDRLTHDRVTPGIEQFQLLNFSVYAYSVLQMMDAALEDAPRYHPDVYMVSLTSLGFIDNKGWRNHLGRLIQDRVDLKYPYLKDLVAKAGIRPTDSLGVIVTKLKPFFIPVNRWALGQIRDHAASEGARMIIVLLPAPINADLTEDYFNRLHPAVDGLGIPVIDLQDTFRSVTLNDFQVAPGRDFHPNVAGHQRIFDRLYAALRSQPDAWAAITGKAAEPARGPSN
jgi:hypothetical protein